MKLRAPEKLQLGGPHLRAMTDKFGLDGVRMGGAQQ